MNKDIKEIQQRRRRRKTSNHFVVCCVPFKVHASFDNMDPLPTGKEVDAGFVCLNNCRLASFMVQYHRQHSPKKKTTSERIKFKYQTGNNLPFVFVPFNSQKKNFQVTVWQLIFMIQKKQQKHIATTKKYFHFSFISITLN